MTNIIPQKQTIPTCEGRDYLSRVAYQPVEVDTVTILLADEQINRAVTTVCACL